MPCREWLKKGRLSLLWEDGRLCFKDENGGLFCSPAEGLWSIAEGWQSGHPADWAHGMVCAGEAVADGVVLSGEVRLKHGVCRMRDSILWNGDVLEIHRRWHYEGEPVAQATLSVRFLLPGSFAEPVLPGILYYGNPHGARTPSVPGLKKETGGKAFFEEHRFPVPMAVAEKETGGGAALHSVPSPVPGAAREDLWWSLGAEYTAEGTELALYSGYLSCNGRDSVVKTGQKKLEEYPGTWLTLQDGMTVEKHFRLQLIGKTEKGSAFLPALDRAADFWRPAALPLDFQDVIRRKYQQMCRRFVRRGTAAGASFVPDGPQQEKIVFGWCGRSECIGYAAPILGPLFGDAEAENRAEAVWDFLCTSPFTEEGFAVVHHTATGEWEQRDFVSQGQTLETFCLALLYRKKHNLSVKPEYLKFLRRASECLSRRVSALAWEPVSTNEAFLCAPLFYAAALLDEPRFRTAARKIAEHYLARHRDMTEPYWGGTLDACCEDKEGAHAAMTAFFAAYEATGEERFLKGAEHAAGVFLTYYQMWDIAMKPGPLADCGFRSAGWTAVSVQNMHLDVYGVWAVPLLEKIARACGRTEWLALVQPMAVNAGQLVDLYGNQGEQIQQTNFGQHFQNVPLERLRGDYVESWQVFWITAAFLQCAAQWQELQAPGCD